MKHLCPPFRINNRFWIFKTDEIIKSADFDYFQYPIVFSLEMPQYKRYCNESGVIYYCLPDFEDIVVLYLAIISCSILERNAYDWESFETILPIPLLTLLK